MQIRRAGELAVLRYDAEQNGMQEDNDVHRENADTDPEARRRWNALRGWQRASRTRTPCRKRSTGKWAVRRR